MSRQEGPQTTLQAWRTAGALSADDHDVLHVGRPTLLEALLGAPKWDDQLVEAVNARAKTPGRDGAF